MYKKITAVLLTLFLVLSAAACAEQAAQPSTQNQPQAPSADPVDTQPKESEPLTYSYKVEAMQNADCRYVEPNFYLVLTDSHAGKEGAILVWPQCPACYEGSAVYEVVDPAELNFSTGDTIMYSDTYECFDCYWDRDIDQFMWTISVTRTPK